MCRKCFFPYDCGNIRTPWRRSSSWSTTGRSSTRRTARDTRRLPARRRRSTRRRSSFSRLRGPGPESTQRPVTDRRLLDRQRRNRDSGWYRSQFSLPELGIDLIHFLQSPIELGIVDPGARQVVHIVVTNGFIKCRKPSSDRCTALPLADKAPGDFHVHLYTIGQRRVVEVEVGLV